MENIDWERAAQDIPPDVRRYAPVIAGGTLALVAALYLSRRNHRALITPAISAVIPSTDAGSLGGVTQGGGGNNITGGSGITADPAAADQRALATLQDQLSIEQQNSRQTELLREQGGTFDAGLQVSTARDLGAVTLNLAGQQITQQEGLLSFQTAQDLQHASAAETLRQSASAFDMAGALSDFRTRDGISQADATAQAARDADKARLDNQLSQSAAAAAAALQIQQDAAAAALQRTQSTQAHDQQTVSAQLTLYQSLVTAANDAQARTDAAKAAIPGYVRHYQHNAFGIVVGKTDNQGEIDRLTAVYLALKTSSDAARANAAANKPA